MEFLKIIWRKKYFVFIIVFFSMGATILFNKIKPPIYKTEATVLIFAPYNSNNSNLPSSPYSSKLFKDLFYGLNLKNIVIEKNKKKDPQTDISREDLEEMVSIEFFDKSNLAKIHVSHSSSQILMDLANIIAESFVTLINETLNLEFVEIDKIFGKELNDFGKKLSEIENELKELQLPNNAQFVSDYNTSTSQIYSYKNQMRDLEISFDGIENRIKELERQLKEEEKGHSEPNQGIINSLKNQINAQKIEEAAKSAEMKKRGEYIANLEKEIEVLNQKAMQLPNNTQVVSDYNNNLSQLSSYKNQMRDLEISFGVIENRIKELERQLKEEEEGHSEPNQGIINSLKNQINAQKIEEAAKSAEIKTRAEYIVKLEPEIEVLNQKIVQYNKEMANYSIENKRLEMERSLAEAQLRSMAAKAEQAKLDAKSKQISAKIIDFPKEPQLVKDDLRGDLVWAGVGSLIFSVVFLWLFFL